MKKATEIIDIWIQNAGDFKLLEKLIEEQLLIADHEGWLRCYNYVMNKIDGIKDDEKVN